jgi:hypothetical protein
MKDLLIQNFEAQRASANVPTTPQAKGKDEGIKELVSAAKETIDLEST